MSGKRDCIASSTVSLNASEGEMAFLTEDLVLGKEHALCEREERREKVFKEIRENRGHETEI
jgi:hypothetical protein